MTLPEEETTAHSTQDPAINQFCEWLIRYSRDASKKESLSVIWKKLIEHNLDLVHHIEDIRPKLKKNSRPLQILDYMVLSRKAQDDRPGGLVIPEDQPLQGLIWANHPLAVVESFQNEWMTQNTGPIRLIVSSQQVTEGQPIRHMVYGKHIEQGRTVSLWGIAYDPTGIYPSWIEFSGSLADYALSDRWACYSAEQFKTKLWAAISLDPVQSAIAALTQS